MHCFFFLYLPPSRSRSLCFSLPVTGTVYSFYVRGMRNFSIFQHENVLYLRRIVPSAFYKPKLPMVLIFLVILLLVYYFIHFLYFEKYS